MSRLFRTYLLPTMLSGAWISASEFFRNELLFKSSWVDHYASLGLVFPNAPINGIVWVVWSFAFAGLISFLVLRLSLIEATLTAWFFAFVLMWLVTGNLLVFPFSILFFAVPLSLAETFVACFIVRRTRPKALPLTTES